MQKLHPYKIVSAGRLCLLILITIAGCKKYLQTDPPIDSIPGSAVFQDDKTAAAALSAVYAQLYHDADFDGYSGIGFFMGLYGDELSNQSPIDWNIALYTDALGSSVFHITQYWTDYYSLLYSLNRAIEALKPATRLDHRDQWLGEALFTRALLYFYLTNIYGDLPLALSSDYRTNNTLARSPQSDIYKQIISDLLQAQSLLDNRYQDANGQTTTDKARPNRAAATALLARVFLYTQDWTNAESQAGTLIADSTDYHLTALSQVFLLNSPEIIWGLEPTQSWFGIVRDARTYQIPPGQTPAQASVAATLSDSLVQAFEPGDARSSVWVGIDTVLSSGNTPQTLYFYASKYKAAGTYTTPVEMVVLFRLAEQYLIRAEARFQLGNTTGAFADLNLIRTRAGLPPSTSTSSDIAAAILHERRVELFTEEAHRFFDLRRTGNLDAVMNPLAPLKGGSWSPYKAWWPIPPTDIGIDPNLAQTPGYP